MSSLGLDYALRVSPAYYNTPEEIEALAHGLERIIPMLRRGDRRYGQAERIGSACPLFLAGLSAVW